MGGLVVGNLVRNSRRHVGDVAMADRLIDFGDDGWDREPRPDQLELFEPPTVLPARIPPPYTARGTRRVEDADIKKDRL